jgi:hypothetical protein
MVLTILDRLVRGFASSAREELEAITYRLLAGEMKYKKTGNNNSFYCVHSLHHSLIFSPSSLLSLTFSTYCFTFYLSLPCVAVHASMRADASFQLCRQALYGGCSSVDGKRRREERGVFPP